MEFPMKFITALAISMLSASAIVTAQAQNPAAPRKPVEPPVIVSEVWIKTTIPGTSVSAAYMRIQSPIALSLLRVEAPIAADIQIHDMKLNNGVMEMKALDSVAIPVGQMVELKPGGKHVMLTQLAGPIRNGDKVPLTLIFEDAGKKKISIRVDAVAMAGANAGRAR